MALRVFIGHDSRFPEPGRVLAYSMQKQSSVPLDIRFLDQRHLEDCHDFRRMPDPKAATEFTYSRFLVPWLCGYEGTALFVDNDMLCLGDMAQMAAIAELRNFGALACVHHDYTPPAGTKMLGVKQEGYPRKLWSSCMLMDCARLKCWTKGVVETASGARLHRFEDIPDSDLGELDLRWNEVYTIHKDTMLFHWTEGMTWNDPNWREQRKLNQLPEYQYRDLWLMQYDAMCARDREESNGTTH